MRQKNLLLVKNELLQYLMIKVINNSIIHPAKIAIALSDNYDMQFRIRKEIRSFIRYISQNYQLHYLQYRIIAKGINRVYYKIGSKSYLKSMQGKSKNEIKFVCDNHSPCIQQLIKID